MRYIVFIAFFLSTLFDFYVYGLRVFELCGVAFWLLLLGPVLGSYLRISKFGLVIALYFLVATLAGLDLKTYIVFACFFIVLLSSKYYLQLVMRALPHVIAMHIFFFFMQFFFGVDYFVHFELQSRLDASYGRYAGLYQEPAHYVAMMSALLCLYRTRELLGSIYERTLISLAIISLLLSGSMFGVAMFFLLSTCFWRSIKIIAVPFSMVGIAIEAFIYAGENLKYFLTLYEVIHWRLLNIGTDTSFVARFSGFQENFNFAEYFVRLSFNNDYGNLGSSYAAFLIHGAGVVGCVLMFLLIYQGGERLQSLNSRFNKATIVLVLMLMAPVLKYSVFSMLLLRSQDEA